MVYFEYSNHGGTDPPFLFLVISLKGLEGAPFSRGVSW